MRLLIFLLLLSCAQTERSFETQWTNNTNIKNPESVYVDTVSRLVFVSNVDGTPDGKDGKGHISLLNLEGKTLNANWIEGFNAPKGMRSYNNNLYVADIDEVVKIDINKGKVLKRIKVPGAKLLNDVAIDKKGVVYVSDTFNSAIYKINGNKVTTFISGDKWESPNGLLIKNHLMFVTSWGLTTDWSTKVPGRLYVINLITKEMKYITKTPVGNLDGLEFDQDGNFIVSDWVNGKIFRITHDGKVTTLFKGEKGLADIGYDRLSNQVFIPYMLSNKVFSLKI